eukprot:1487241-Rhodomonas_salina.1
MRRESSGLPLLSEPSTSTEHRGVQTEAWMPGLEAEAAEEERGGVLVIRDLGEGGSGESMSRAAPRQ